MTEKERLAAEMEVHKHLQAAMAKYQQLPGTTKLEESDFARAIRSGQYIVAALTARRML